MHKDVISGLETVTARVSEEDRCAIGAAGRADGLEFAREGLDFVMQICRGAIADIPDSQDVKVVAMSLVKTVETMATAIRAFADVLVEELEATDAHVVSHLTVAGVEVPDFIPDSL